MIAVVHQDVHDRSHRVGNGSLVDVTQGQSVSYQSFFTGKRGLSQENFRRITLIEFLEQNNLLTRNVNISNC